MQYSAIDPKTGARTITSERPANFMQAARQKPELVLAGIQMSAATVDSVIAAAKRSTSKTPYLDSLAAAHRSQTPAKASAAKPVIHRAITAAAKPTTAATSAPVATITAAQFAKPEVRMTRGEFNLLTHADRSRFFASGGKLVS